MSNLEEFKILADALGRHLQGDFEGQALLSEIEESYRSLYDYYRDLQYQLPHDHPEHMN